MENNNNHHNGIGNGFLLGLIVGALLALLFTTKRGRAILKDVLENGTKKFSNLEQLMRETEAGDLLEDETKDNDYVPEVSKEVPEEVKKQKQAAREPETEKAEEETKIQEPEAKSIKEEPKPVEKKKEEKPKAPRGKRWFRMRKRN